MCLARAELHTVTSRGPQDIPTFNTAMIALFAKARPLARFINGLSIRHVGPVASGRPSGALMRWGPSALCRW